MSNRQDKPNKPNMAHSELSPPPQRKQKRTKQSPGPSRSLLNLSKWQCHPQLLQPKHLGAIRRLVTGVCLVFTSLSPRRCRVLGDRDILRVAASRGFKQHLFVDRVRTENWLGQAALAWRPWLRTCPVRDGPSGPGGAAPGGSAGSGTGLSAGQWVCRGAE